MLVAVQTTNASRRCCVMLVPTAQHCCRKSTADLAWRLSFKDADVCRGEDPGSSATGAGSQPPETSTPTPSQSLPEPHKLALPPLPTIKLQLHNPPPLPTPPPRAPTPPLPSTSRSVSPMMDTPESSFADAGAMIHSAHGDVDYVPISNAAIKPVPQVCCIVSEERRQRALCGSAVLCCLRAAVLTLIWRAC